MKQGIHKLDIRTLAVLISLLLSAWHALLYPIPNADAFEYVRIAHAYLDDGIAAAFERYPSATYPVLLGTVHQLTGLDLFIGGQLISALFFALLVHSFITLAQLLRPSPRIGLLAALVVLTFPSLNELRSLLIRDTPFLALMLTAAVQLIRFGLSLRSLHAIAFVLLSLTAALFRAEALAYLALAPLALLFGHRDQWGRNVRAVLTLEAALLSAGMVGLLAGAALGVDFAGALQRMFQVYWPFLRDAISAISEEDSPLSRAIFGEYAANFSDDTLWVFMLTGLAAVLVVTLMETFGLTSLILFAWSARRMPRGETTASHVLLAYALVAFLIPLGFLLLTRFLAHRYTMLFCLSCLVFLPLVIDRAWSSAGGSRRPRLWRGMLVFLLAYSFADSHIRFHNSDDSLEQASEWVQQNTRVGDVVFTNNSYIAYYSGRVKDYDKVVRYIADDVIENTPFGTIIVLTRGRAIDEQIQRNLEFQRIEPLAQFPAGDDPRVLVFRRLGN